MLSPREESFPPEPFSSPPMPTPRRLYQTPAAFTGQASPRSLSPSLSPRSSQFPIARGSPSPGSPFRSPASGLYHGGGPSSFDPISPHSVSPIPHHLGDQSAVLGDTARRETNTKLLSAEAEMSRRALDDASPTTRARFREILTAYDTLLESRITALSEVAAREEKMRRHVKFEARESQHNALAQQLGRKIAKDLQAGEDGTHEVSSSTLAAFGIAEGQSLDTKTQDAFDKATGDVKKMFKFLKMYEARKREKERAREFRRQYNSMMFDARSPTGGDGGGSPGGTDDWETGSMSGASFRGGQNLSATFGSFRADDFDGFLDRHGSSLSTMFKRRGSMQSDDSMSMMGGDDGGGSSVNDEKFADPQYVRQRLETEKAKNASLRQQLQDAFRSHVRVVWNRADEAEIRGVEAAATKYPGCCSCVDCLGALTKALHTAQDSLGAAAERCARVRVHVASSSATGDQLARQLQKERMRHLTLTNRKARLVKDLGTLHAQLSLLDGCEATQFTGDKSSAAARAAKRSLELSSAASASTPVAVQCVELVRAHKGEHIAKHFSREKADTLLSTLEIVGVLEAAAAQMRASADSAMHSYAVSAGKN